VKKGRYKALSSEPDNLLLLIEDVFAELSESTSCSHEINGRFGVLCLESESNSCSDEVEASIFKQSCGCLNGIIDLLYVLADFTFSAKKKMRKKLFFS
jgi:hypothetical protein